MGTMPRPILWQRRATLQGTTAPVREVCSVLHRLDAVPATARARGNPSQPAIAAAGEAVQQVVTRLSFREQVERRQAGRPSDTSAEAAPRGRSVGAEDRGGHRSVIPGERSVTG